MMRVKSLILIAIGLLGAAGLQADIFLLQKNHTDEYYNGGQMNPAEDRTHTYWVGENRLALISDSRRVVLDGAENRLLFINLRDKTFVEGKLPLDRNVLFPESLLQRMSNFPTVGEVAATNEKKEIEGFPCVAYRVHSWVPYEGMKYNESESTQWYTTQVPFDLPAFTVLFRNLRELNNFSDGFRKALDGVPGFMVCSEGVRYREGTPIKSRIRIEKMEKRDPPAGVYAVPAEFTKKEKISLEDLRGL